MDSTVTKRIAASLDGIRKAHDVAILLAIEAGNRAWGFASRDSDYDIRSLYVRQLDDYLRISQIQDVMELPITTDLDISSWDLQKALGLLAKCVLSTQPSGHF